MTQQMKEALDKAKQELIEKCPSSYIEDRTDPNKGIYLVPIRLMDDAIEAYLKNLWHDASEEPCDMGHCLIYFGVKGKGYLDFGLVFYNKQEKVFLTESYPHPTGYKVEQKSLDGGCSAEVYKNKRDRYPLSDIAKWCYLSDIL